MVQEERMKKSVLILLSIVISLAFISACMTGPEEKPPTDIPRFYLNPPASDDALYGVGSAKMSKLDSSRKMALARAREDIAFQVSTTVKAAITDYAQEAGADNNNQVLSFVETVTRQITETRLVGTKISDVYVSKDGTVFALVEYPLGDFLLDAEEEFERNEDAAFAEFKAAEALKKLEWELENNPPHSAPVTN